MQAHVRHQPGRHAEAQGKDQAGDRQPPLILAFQARQHRQQTTQQCQPQAQDPGPPVTSKPLPSLGLQVAHQPHLEIGQAWLVAAAQRQWRILCQQLSQPLALLCARRIEGSRSPLQHETAVRLILQAQQTADRPVGETHRQRPGLVEAVAQTAMPEVADAGRRQIVRRLETGEVRASLRITADSPPGTPVVPEQAQPQQDAQDQAEVVVQQPHRLLQLPGTGHDTRRPVDRQGQAVLRRQGRGGPQLEITRALLDDPVILAPLPAGPGVGMQGAHAGATGQIQAHRGLQDGEAPVVAGNIPVELVPAFMGEQLRIDAVTQLIGVTAMAQPQIRRAEVETLIGADSLAAHLLGQAIAGGAQQIDGRLAQQAAGQAIVHRDVAVDTALDPVALGLHGDALDHLQHAVVAKLQLHAEILDQLLRRDHTGQQAAQQQQDLQQPCRHVQNSISGDCPSRASSRAK